MSSSPGNPFAGAGSIPPLPVFFTHVLRRVLFAIPRRFPISYPLLSRSLSRTGGALTFLQTGEKTGRREKPGGQLTESDQTGGTGSDGKAFVGGTSGTSGAHRPLRSGREGIGVFRRRLK
jgi:hypothetical protein